jgi:hypothetical protein
LSFITTVDFTSSPDMPMASALCLGGLDDLPTGCLMPRLTTV